MSRSQASVKRRTPGAGGGRNRREEGKATRLSTEKGRAPLLPAASKALKLLSIDQIPEWYAENPFIRTGYRPVSGSWAACLGSWLQVHNQTANIATHLLPAVLAVGGNAGLRLLFAASYPGAGAADRAVFHVYLTACALCFGLSAAYHTLLCHSRGAADLWVRLDYAGISVLILGSFVPGLYMGFYCEPGLQALYLGMISSMGVLNIYLSVNDRFGAKDWFTSRLLPFVGMGFSAFVPIVHAALIFPYGQLQKQAGLNYYYLEGACMLTGIFFLASRFPERWLPGVFDYWGASHQIFHCFVVLGAASHLAGIFSAFDWNYTHQRCAAR